MSIVNDIVGQVQNPLPQVYQGIEGGGGSPGGLILFFTNMLRIVFVVSGIFAFLNFIIAGFQYMSSAGDPKALSGALNRIWYSMLGLIVIVGSFALAALLGKIIFNDPGFILSPKIYGPTP